MQRLATKPFQGLHHTLAAVLRQTETAAIKWVADQRIFDDRFDLDRVQNAELRLQITGEDGFTLEGESLMREISRSHLKMMLK